MEAKMIFWMLMILWLLFGVFTYWPAPGTKPWPLAHTVLLWVVIALLGWHTFGAAITK